MKGTHWEFRHRGLVIAAVYMVAFSLYALQRVPSAEWLASRLGGTPVPGWAYRVVFSGAALVLALASALRTWGTAYLGRSVVYDPQVRSETLVSDGPYRYVRNPLYLGTLLTGIGLGVLAPPAGWVALVGGLWLLIRRLVGREEAFLVERHGETFRRYRRAVPRLVPAPRPRLPTSGGPVGWHAAWLEEGNLAFLVAAMASVALTLEAVPFEVLVCAGAVFTLTISRRSRPRERKAPPTERARPWKVRRGSSGTGR